MTEIIKMERSVIPACDLASDFELERLVKETCKIPGIGGYKIGLQLTIIYGLKYLVEIVRKYTDLPVIYDHQKAATDIPDIGKNFAAACKTAGVNAVILFPFGGSLTEQVWIRSCKDSGLHVIVGGHMTQPEFLRSEGGFISDDAPMRIYEIAAKSGITDFVVPGNKPEFVREYRKFFENIGIPYVFYAPGFLTQGGNISDCGRIAGEKWHAIVGSAIYKAKNIEEAARNFVKEILS